MEIYPKKPIRIGSKAELDKEIRRIDQLFKKGETEETWEAFSLALKNLTVWTVEDQACEYEGFVNHLKALQKPLIKILTTERTRLLGSATDFLKSLSRTMKTRVYDKEVHDLFAPTLLCLFAKTNKVVHTRTLDCYKTLIHNAKLPRMIPKFAILLKSKKQASKSVRQCVATCLDTLIDANETQVITQAYQRLIEEAVQSAAMDFAPEVRLAIRCCYKTYCRKFPEAVSKFEEKLPADIKKYLSASIQPSPKLSRTTSRSSISSNVSSTSLSSTPSIKKKTIMTKTKTTMTPKKPLSTTTTLAAGRITKRVVPRLASISKSRNSAPQLATAKLPLIQKPRKSTSASAAIKSKIPNHNNNSNNKATSVLLSKPAATRKPALPIQNKSHLTQLTRATTSSLQKSKSKTGHTAIRPMQKTFTLQGMKPSRPVMKRPVSDGDENNKPAKKQNVAI